MRHLLILPFLVSACVSTTTGSVEPVSARLSSDVLRIKLSNGHTCVGGVMKSRTRAWVGDLGNCEGWRFRVTLSERTNPTRYIVEEVLTTLTLEDTLAPAAEITVTSPEKITTTFVHPKPR